jgi:hypothetical protein
MGLNIFVGMTFFNTEIDGFYNVLNTATVIGLMPHHLVL